MSNSLPNIIKNDLPFESLENSFYNFHAFKGRPAEEMYRLKAVYEKQNGARTYEIPNFADLNLCIVYGDERIRPSGKELILDNGFLLVANPIIGSRQQEEYLLVNDIRHKVFRPLRERILSMSKDYKFSEEGGLLLADNPENAEELYERFKREGAQYLTIINKEEAEMLRPKNCIRNINAGKKQEEILENLLFGEKHLIQDYKALLGKKPKFDKNDDSLFYFFMDSFPFSGIRFISASPLAKSRAVITARYSMKDTNSTMLLINGERLNEIWFKKLWRQSNA